MMPRQEFKNLIKKIVVAARSLKDKYTDQKDAPVSYVAIFCQNDEEYEEFTQIIRTMSSVINETSTGFHYKIDPLETVSGTLNIVKIRRPDKRRTERGDADFNVEHYDRFKKTYVHRPRFKLILRKDHEMIELMEKGANVRVYFSNPHVDLLLGIK